MKYLYFIFIEHKWRSEHKRIDSILNELSSNPGNSNEMNQVLYISLRELCRKFNGYDHVNIDRSIYQPLELPKNTFYHSEDNIRKRITAPHTGWSSLFNNKNIIPLEWINISISLYKGYESHIISLPEYYNEVFEEYNQDVFYSSYMIKNSYFSFY